MTVYAIGTARLSSEPPPVHEPFPGLGTGARYDLHPLSEQRFPTAVVDWDAVFPDVPVPTYIYPCTEGTGALEDGRVPASGGAEALVPTGGPLYRRRAVGLRAPDGEDTVAVHPVRGVELIDESQKFEAGDASWFNPGAADMAMLVVYRIKRVPTDDPLAIAGKYRTDELGSNGFILGLDENGLATFQADRFGGAHLVVKSSDRGDDGAWHCSLVAIEHTTGGTYAHHFCDLGLTTSASDPDPAVSFDSTAGFCIGQSDLWDGVCCQVAFVALWKAADVDQRLFARDALEAFWTAFDAPKNADDPQDKPLHLDQDGGAGWMSGVDPFGTGNLVTKSGRGQVPYAVMGDAALDHGGFAPNPEVVNLLQQTERFLTGAGDQTWSHEGSVVLNAQVCDGPDGLRSAARAVFSLSGGSVTQDTVPVADSIYAGSIWVQLLASGDPNATLRVGKSVADSTEVPIAALLLNRWTRLWHAQDAVGVTTFGIWLEKGSETGDVELALWGAQLEDGLDNGWFPGPYVASWDQATGAAPTALSLEWGPPEPGYEIRGRGTAALKVRFPYGVDQAEGRTLLRFRGPDGTPEEVDVHLTRNQDGGDHGRIILLIRKGGGDWGKVVSHQATGLVGQQPAEEAAEVVITFGWDFSQPLLQLEVDGTAGNVTLVPTTVISGFQAQALNIGHDGDETGQLGAPIYDVELESR